jgi:hypothetical protein
VHKPLPQYSQTQTDPEKLAEALLAEAEKRNRPIVERSDPDGKVMFDAARPPVEQTAQGWEVVEWEPRKPEKPRKRGQPTRAQEPRKRGRPKGAPAPSWVDEEDRVGLKLEKAIHNAVNNNPGQRSSRAITKRIITDRESRYYGLTFDTLYKRVNAAIKQRGISFWEFCGSHELAPAEPSVELLHELGLQSLKYLEQPFGGRII